MMSDYEAFLASKAVTAAPAGMAVLPALNPALFGHQRDTVAFALGRGRAAAFLDTGLGKSFVEGDWARAVAEETRRPVLGFTPLAVGRQMVADLARFGIEARVVRGQSELRPGINLANYEILHKFDPAGLGGVFLDESSILKNFMGATKRALLAFAEGIPFRLAGTATPAPNDVVELGNHAAFLGVMPANEMLMRWFINDASSAGTWRLKGHAAESFYAWVADWAMCVSRPSDLGYPDEGYSLPALEVRRHLVATDPTAGIKPVKAGEQLALLRLPDSSATSLHREKRISTAARALRVAEIVRGIPDFVVVWCDTNYEADALKAAIPEAIEVRGNDRDAVKEERLAAFGEGRARVLVTKPSLCGWGLNWQHCNRCVFAGLSYSYEAYYQAVRRFWRFGQRRPVTVDVVLADTELAVWDAVRRKADEHERLKTAMYAAGNRARAAAATVKRAYDPAVPARLPPWIATPSPSLSSLGDGHA